MYEAAAPESDEHIHSFIVKLWLESAAADNHLPVWGGHITHVPSRERRSVRQLDDIVAFMAPYLAGVRRGDRRDADGA